MHRVALAGLVAVLGCVRAPPGPQPLQLSRASLAVVSQDLFSFSVTFTGDLAGATGPARASYELVMDGAVLRRGTATFEALDGGQFSFTESVRMAPDTEAVTALAERGTPALVAIRGELTAGAGTVELARAVEVRAPRLPRLTLAGVEAGRFSGSEVEMAFHLSLTNPNPFPVRLSGIDYAIAVASRPIVQGEVGAGDLVPAAAASVFDVSALVLERTYGPDVNGLIASRRLPYSVTATARVEGLTIPMTVDAELRLP